MPVYLRDGETESNMYRNRDRQIHKRRQSKRDRKRDTEHERLRD